MDTTSVEFFLLASDYYIIGCSFLCVVCSCREKRTADWKASRAISSKAAVQGNLEPRKTLFNTPLPLHSGMNNTLYNTHNFEASRAFTRQDLEPEMRISSLWSFRLWPTLAHREWTLSRSLWGGGTPLQVWVSMFPWVTGTVIGFICKVASYHLDSLPCASLFIVI